MLPDLRGMVNPVPNYRRKFPNPNMAPRSAKVLGVAGLGVDWDRESVLEICGSHGHVIGRVLARR